MSGESLLAQGTAADVVVEHLDALVTMDEQQTELGDAWVAVSAGVIVGLGSGRPPEARRHLAGTGLVALPGLVNTHHHFFQTLTRALPEAQDLRVIEWLAVNYPIWTGIDEDAVYTTARVAIGEMLLSGCTTSSDHLYVFPKSSAGATALLQAEIGAARELGLRFHPCRGAVDVSLDAGGSPPPTLVEQTDAVLENMEEAVDRFHDPSPGSMCRLSLAPCSLTISSERLMRESAALASRLGVSRHTHVSEVVEEVDYCGEVYGCRPIERLEELGWLGRDVWLAHVVHPSDQEIERLAATGTAVAHCPSSNMRLGSGIAPVLRMRERGVVVGVGVDGSSSNDSGNILAETRQAMFASRVSSDGGRLMRAREALQMATVGGAAALQRDDVGSLTPGRRADIAFFRPEGLGAAGAENDPVAALLLSPPARAEHVMVEGHFAVFDGHLRVDEDEIARAHRELVRRLVPGRVAPPRITRSSRSKQLAEIGGNT